MVGANRGTNNRLLHLVPTHAGLHAMPLKAHPVQGAPGANTQPDVIALRPPRLHHYVLNVAGALERAVIHLDAPTHLPVLQPLHLIHRYVIRGPVLHLTVRGDDPEHARQSVPFYPHLRARLAQVAVAHGSIPGAVHVDAAIALQLCQPAPTAVPHQPQVVSRRIPTVEQHAFRREPALFGGEQHRGKVFVLGDAIVWLVEHAPVARHHGVPIRPHHRHQVDAIHHGVMLARPVPVYQLHLARVRLIERGIVENEHAACALNLSLHLLPERGGVGFQAVQQPREGVVGERTPVMRLYPHCLSRAHDTRRRDQELDVVFVTAAWCIHAPTLSHSRRIPQLRKS